MRIKGIIPTGGRGTRMQPLTFSSNKHFIPVANKPLIFYPVETIAAIGVKEVGITYNPGYLEQVKKLLGDGKRWGLKFTYILQEKPAGLANIVEVCESFVAGDSFVFHLGDNIFVDGIEDAANHFLKTKPDGLITMIHHSENKRMWVPYFNKKGKLVKNVEKPENPPNDWAIPGVYFANSNFFKAFKGKDRIKPSVRGEYEIPAPFQWLIDHHFFVDTIEYKGKWLDPGKFDDWIAANQFLLDNMTNFKISGRINKSSSVEGRVSVGKGCKIVDSKIRGPVSIGSGVKIKNSYIGPYTAISDNVEIENSHVENSIVMEGVRIKSISKPIDNSMIGPHSDVSNNTEPSAGLHLFVGEKSEVKI